MSVVAEFNAADYGIEWPNSPADIIAEALLDYVGDGEGVDKAVLEAFVDEVKAQALAELATEWGVGDVGGTDETVSALDRADAEDTIKIFEGGTLIYRRVTDWTAAEQ